MEKNYLYHYYPIRESGMLKEEDGNETIETLLGDKKREDLSYPYRDLSDLQYLLGSKKLWLNRCESQNDPFEFEGYYEKNFACKQVLIEKKSESSFKPYKGKELIPWREIFKLKNHGMYSFSLSKSSILMWSYYASGHQGVCIRFKVSDELNESIKIKNTVKMIQCKIENDDKSAGPVCIFGKTIYGACRHNKPLIFDDKSYLHFETQHKDLMNDTSKSNPNNYFNEKFTVLDYMNTIITLKKHCEWKHEKEFRLIVLGWEGEIALKQLLLQDPNKALFQIDAVIFGCNTSEIVEKIIKNSFGSDLKYVKSKMKMGTYSLGFK